LQVKIIGDLGLKLKTTFHEMNEMKEFFDGKDPEKWKSPLNSHTAQKYSINPSTMRKHWLFNS